MTVITKKCLDNTTFQKSSFTRIDLVNIKNRIKETVNSLMKPTTYDPELKTGSEYKKKLILIQAADSMRIATKS